MRGARKQAGAMRWSPIQTAPGRRGKNSAWSTARFVLVLVLIAWTIRSFVLAPFSIPSGSMLPTLYIGDYLVVAKWPYGYSRYSFPFSFPAFSGRIFEHLPRRGDVVVSLRGKPVLSDDDLRTQLSRLKPGDRVTLGLERDGRRREADLVLDEPPAPAGRPRRRQG